MTQCRTLLCFALVVEVVFSPMIRLGSPHYNSVANNFDATELLTVNESDFCKQGRSSTI